MSGDTRGNTRNRHVGARGVEKSGSGNDKLRINCRGPLGGLCQVFATRPGRLAPCVARGWALGGSFVGGLPSPLPRFGFPGEG